MLLTLSCWEYRNRSFSRLENFYFTHFIYTSNVKFKYLPRRPCPAPGERLSLSLVSILSICLKKRESARARGNLNGKNVRADENARVLIRPVLTLIR